MKKATRKGERKIPKFVTDRYVNGARAFKQLKRMQVRAAIKAMNNLQFGCAYFPTTYPLFCAARESLLKIQKDLSVKSWGR